MPEQTKFGAWAVCLVFANGGPLIVNTIIAPSPEGAAAKIVEGVMRELKPEQELTGLATVPISVEWLRMALRAIESGEKPPGQALALVPKDNAAQEEAAREAQRETHRWWRPNGPALDPDLDPPAV